VAFSYLSCGDYSEYEPIFVSLMYFFLMMLSFQLFWFVHVHLNASKVDTFIYCVSEWHIVRQQSCVGPV